MALLTVRIDAVDCWNQYVSSALIAGDSAEVAARKADVLLSILLRRLAEMDEGDVAYASGELH